MKAKTFLMPEKLAEFVNENKIKQENIIAITGGNVYTIFFIENAVINS